MPINMNNPNSNYSNDSYHINLSNFPIAKNLLESYGTLSKNINFNKSKHRSCKDYLEMIKRQRELMEEDIKRRKANNQVRRMEEIIRQNKKIQERNQKKVKDSLDKLQKDEEQRRAKAKSERAHSAYSSELQSLNEAYVKTIRPQSKANRVNILQEAKQIKQFSKQELKKQDEIQKIKQEMLEKYRFAGETGKKPKKVDEIQDKTVVDWWINKVKKFREEEAIKKVKQPEPQPQSSSEEDSESDYRSERNRKNQKKPGKK